MKTQPDIPDIKRGQAISAKFLNQIKKAALRGSMLANSFQNGEFTLTTPTRGGGGGDTVISSGANIKVVLIDRDIPGVHELESRLTVEDIIVEESIEESVPEEIDVIFEDPPGIEVPDLELLDCIRRKMNSKYFEVDTITYSCTADGAGSGDNTVLLQNDAEDIDGYYAGGLIETIGGSGSGQEQFITGYTGLSRELEVELDWETPVDDTTQLTITLYVLKLATVITNVDASSPPDQVIVRYAKTSWFWDSGDRFEMGEYQRSDYPDYPENEVFPPDGAGTYQEEDDNFFKKRYRGYVINGHLFREFCFPLPARPLSEVT